MKLVRPVGFGFGLGIALALSGCAEVMQTASSIATGIDIHVPSKPDTVVWGQLPAGRAPVARVRSGQIVEVDTISHQGLINGTDPVQFFAQLGIPASDVLADAIEVYNKVPRPKDAGVHVLTGPIYVEGAEPGDLLAVRIVDFAFRVPYGVNNSNKGTGVLPELHAKPYPKLIKFDYLRNVAVFAPRIELPLNPFMGIMTVTPPGGLANTRPPGAYGGNMDFTGLIKGTTLYLPVLQSGALFYTGDAHALQGDGEVNGTAIETSLSVVLQFTVKKGQGKTLKWPRAEDNDSWYLMGMDTDLNAALKQAAQEAVDFLVREKGMTQADAYALASVVVNFTVGEAVDQVQMVYAQIPKGIFR
jgi:acetamidase/formamidase